ncbi:MAG: dTDP-glucose 4,6-dehydratase, partial [Myxococcota bacterium]
PASPFDYVELPFETMYVNADGSRNCLELAAARGARFFFASTSEVYGDPAVHPQVESYWGNVNPIGPRSVYDEAKRYAEALTMAFHRYRGVQTRIVRIFNTYGPRMRHNDGRVIPAFVTQALQGQPLTIFGDGSQTRSFCFVTDLIDGFVRLMESDLEGPCNIGNPHELSMLQLAEHINTVTGNQAGITFRPLPKDDPTRRRPDNTRAREELGWEPQVLFADGIGRTVEWFRHILAEEGFGAPA